MDLNNIFEITASLIMTIIAFYYGHQFTKDSKDTDRMLPGDDKKQA